MNSPKENSPKVKRGIMSATDEGELLWQPSSQRVEEAGISAFRAWVNENYQKNFDDYGALWQWSVNELEQFWAAIWQYYAIAPGQSYTQVLNNQTMPGAKWFEGAEVNFTEYLLRQGDRGDLSRGAIFAESESGDATSISWAELREQVVCLAQYLRNAGVEPGDRIVAYMPMSIEATVAMLASISVGAVWSCCSPDFGAKSVLERFEAIKPKVLFAISGYRYNGKVFDRREALDAIVQALPSLTELIYLPWLDANTPKPPATFPGCKLTDWQDSLKKSVISYSAFRFAQMPFDAPLWVMYSSGTTGKPKGIVHSQGGVLIEFVKYAWLHDDINPRAIKFFFTTTGWAMFNILVGGMMAGGAIVLYDGCPTYPDRNQLWDICDRYGVTYFGVNPTYVNGLIQADYSPQVNHQLETIKTIALTGSPSSSETFAWFYRYVHQDVQIISMSGGTDVCGAFVAGAAGLPVYAGEIQGPCLGVDVSVFDDEGKPLPIGKDGELVIRRPMPSMPLCFWDDADGNRYHDSYFSHYPGVWRQGDLIRQTVHGGYVISGRSDATLNRFGIRIGTAEIYRAIESLPEIKDSLIVSLELAGARFFMPLFIVLNDGLALENNLIQKIAITLARDCSPRHVPDQVYSIDEVPYTLTGKKLEVPVKKLLLGVPASKALNKSAIANPLAVDFFIDLAGELNLAESS